jgi:hypothetical protein
MFNSNQAFPIGAKIEISPQGLFYTRSQGRNTKTKFNLPQDIK